MMSPYLIEFLRSSCSAYLTKEVAILVSFTTVSAEYLVWAVWFSVIRTHFWDTYIRASHASNLARRKYISLGSCWLASLNWCRFSGLEFIFSPTYSWICLPAQSSGVYRVWLSVIALTILANIPQTFVPVHSEIPPDIPRCYLVKVRSHLLTPIHVRNDKKRHNMSRAFFASHGWDICLPKNLCSKQCCQNFYMQQNFQLNKHQVSFNDAEAQKAGGGMHISQLALKSSWSWPVPTSSSQQSLFGKLLGQYPSWLWAGFEGAIESLSAP